MIDELRLGKDRQPLAGLQAVALAVALIAAMSLGREIFIPLAIAVLLSFILNPLVQVLRRNYFGRLGSVLAAVGLAFSLIAGLGVVIARQVSDLAGDLPRYEATLRNKVQALRGLPVTSGVLEKASETLGKLGAELDPSQRTPGEAVTRAPGTMRTEPRPIPVEVREPPPRAFDSFQRFLVNALTPLANGGIVLLLVVCILLQQKDLRDRVIRLVGARDLERTTRAMDDAASRLSQFYLAQTIANAAYGSALGIGLLLIGVPNPFLWGIMAGVLRFVPTLGGPLAAALPTVIAAAVDPGWTMVMATAGLYLSAEIIMGQFVEPRLRGRSTGLSPLAALLATMFWTWAWGPIGLVMATPLTVLLIVLGKHVDSLGFLEVVLGAAPALTPPQIFYQRLLSGDPEEAASQAESELQERSFVDYADQIAVPGLQLAQADLKRGTLDTVRTLTILRSLENLIGYLPDVPENEPPEEDLPADGEASVVAAQRPVNGNAGAGVVIIGGRSPLDEAAALLFGRVVTEHDREAFIVTAREFGTPAGAAKITTAVSLVVISYLDRGSAQMHARFMVRRIRRSQPGVPIVVCLWQDDETRTEPLIGAALLGVDDVVATMRDASAALVRRTAPINGPRSTQRTPAPVA